MDMFILLVRLSLFLSCRVFLWCIIGSGDPSLGSWRYNETTTADFIIKKWVETIKQAGIRKCRGIIGDTSRWNNTQTIIIDGWTWNDIGYIFYLNYL